MVRLGAVEKIFLTTGYDDDTPIVDIVEKLAPLKQSLLESDIFLDIQFNKEIHDREIKLDNGWIIKIGRGLHFYQPPNGYYEIGANDLALRKCVETKVDIYKVG